MKRLIRLSLEGLPVFVGTPMFCCISPEIEERLRVLPDTFARLRVACRFLQNFGAPRDELHVHEEELLPMWAGYLRAALMEYAGMEDTHRADVRRLNLRMAPVLIDATGNAMLILLRELRNLHVHVVQGRFTIASRNVVLRTLSDDPQAAHDRAYGRERTSDISIVTIPRDDLEQLLEPRIAKHYSRAELATAVDWLDDVQNRWGIGDVVLAALEQYSTLLVAGLPTSAA